ncbi:hypothetical protein Plhal703r1_c02g0011631 [Plasmopara halstedii]
MDVKRCWEWRGGILGRDSEFRVCLKLVYRMNRARCLPIRMVKVTFWALNQRKRLYRNIQSSHTLYNSLRKNQVFSTIFISVRVGHSVIVTEVGSVTDISQNLSNNISSLRMSPVSRTYRSGSQRLAIKLLSTKPIVNEYKQLYVACRCAVEPLYTYV